jgi:hypothetical protein
MRKSLLKLTGIDDEGLGKLLNNVPIDKSFTNINPIFLTNIKMNRIKGITIFELISEMFEKIGLEKTKIVSDAWEEEKNNIIAIIHERGYASPDFNEQNIRLFSQISNLKIVKGGDPNDQDSITRLVDLYKSHEYATSNVLQSALIYAGFFGCKISISGPPALDYLIKVSAWLNILGKSEELNQKIADGFRKADENCNFLKLPEHSLRESQHHIEWCSKLLGSDFKMSPDELRKALGLSRLNLLKKYTVHYTMKSARLIDKLFRVKFP